MPEQAPNEAAFEAEIEKLSEGGHRILRLTKEGEEFFVDTTDLKPHKKDFIFARQNGWSVEETGIPLPAYLPMRHAEIKKQGFERAGWGYNKKTTTP